MSTDQDATPADGPAAGSDGNQARLGTILLSLESVVVAVALLGGSFAAFGFTAGQWTALGAFGTACVALVLSLVAHFRPGTQKEPVAVGASLTALVTTFFTMVTAMGWWTPPTPDQQGALIGVLTTIVGLVSAIFARGRVTARS